MNSVPKVPPSPQSDGAHQAPPPVQKIARYDLISVALHWSLAVIIAVELVIGCYLIFRPRTMPGWDALFRLHLSVGGVSVLAVLGMLFWRAFRPAPGLPREIPSWQQWLGQTVDVLLYGVLLLTPLSGYLASVFGGDRRVYPALPLPAWEWNDPALGLFFLQLHWASVRALAALIAIHVVLVVAHACRCPGAIGRMLPFREKRQTPVVLPCEQLAEQESRRLARCLRVFGWVVFWAQLLLGLVALLLLAVAASSTYYSVKVAAASPGVLGAYVGVLVLILTLLGFFYCTRIARRCVRQIEPLPRRLRLLRFLGLLCFTGFVGMASAMMGAASSIALLVAKTVTQPPGIAITDPSRIIRALDVFVLLANFDVLVAHFLGAFFALWLMLYAFRHSRPSKPAAEGVAATGAPGDLPRRGPKPIQSSPSPVSVDQGTTV